MEKGGISLYIQYEPATLPPTQEKIRIHREASVQVTIEALSITGHHQSNPAPPGEGVDGTDMRGRSATPHSTGWGGRRHVQSEMPGTDNGISLKGRSLAIQHISVCLKLEVGAESHCRQP